MEPIAEQLVLPAAYGKGKRTLPWATVRDELTKARVYWLATVRPDGRPHVVPVDGQWDGEENVWYYGGAPETVHRRNVDANPEVVMHVGDGMSAYIVEGAVSVAHLSPGQARRLAAASKEKYGYALDARVYEQIPALRPRVVLAWAALPADATRFWFV